MAIHIVGGFGGRLSAGQVSSDLMPIQVEVNPPFVGAAYGTAQQCFVEVAGGGEIVDRKKQRERDEA